MVFVENGHVIDDRKVESDVMQTPMSTFSQHIDNAESSDGSVYLFTAHAEGPP
ncbi:hypothetical protein RESH_04145 [Rhodopirellula europaea SH398]|uniref:Uncharacterized protein n=1 Tax=Rhodopirellula europaea SH398 TaxID=1263868 RepID=M5SGG0_9BACT|nr:hypothetical protein RESH_04145 [Rhodopirellula europaea SH398]